MRVALVSAHYPPNFVSGGTLVPQRIAQGLAARGHDVAVFAGRLDENEEPLTVRDQTDGDIPVRWVTITPFVPWELATNYDNPAVAAVFAEWLDEVRPDVVHFHAMQTLGGSLVSVAAEAGCRTVVTMHDFWWLCARQFLVDRALRPCSLVVDAGTCGCHAGRDALDVRTRTLRPHLQAADLVLAPSVVTANVLRANGVPEASLFVNENGMDTVPFDTPRRPSAGPVRFRYTGGWDPMKGAGVLAETLKLLEPSDAWQLTVHLPADAPGPLANLSSGGSVVRMVPYAPDELPDVLAQTDVLVLPSLRETHSIMTREALLAGVPVITSDSLGPEEVVDHGRNGLVVPTGDAESLAAAMQSVIDDPALRQRLVDGTGQCPTSTIDEQVDDVERLLTTLVADPRRGSAPSWTPSEVVFVVGIDGAPLRYRAQFPAEALGLVGVATTVLHYADPGVESAVRRADAVVMYRVPATPRILSIIGRARGRGVPVVFDVDDLIVDPGVEDELAGLRSLPAEEVALWRQGVLRYRTTLEHCDAYVGSTTPLLASVGAVTGKATYHKPNAYGLELARLSDHALRQPRDPGPVRIGYLSGTNTHDEDVRSVVPALCAVLDRFPETEVWLIGHLPDDPALAPYGDRVVRRSFQPWTELPALLRQLDINLAPLSDLGAFNQAKSAIKWLEAALVGTPTVARATVPFTEAVTDGVDGVLVHDAADWEPAIAALVADPLRRRSIGATARRTALLEWSPHREGERYLGILRAVQAGASQPARDTTGGRSRRGKATAGPKRWVDVTVDEPAAPGPVPLSPYPPTDGGAPDQLVPPTLRPSLRQRVMRTFRNEGATAVARRVVGRVRRR